jgi:hypothetical protein
LKMIDGEDGNIINYVCYHNDGGVKIIKAGWLRSARNVDRTNDIEMEKLQARKSSARGYNWATLLLWEVSTGTWLSRLGDSQVRQ